MALPRQLGGFILAIALTMAAVISLGTLITALAPSQRIATAAGGLLLFFPLMFFAGLWVPQAEMGAGLRDVSHYTPLGAAVPAVQNAIAGRTGQGPCICSCSPRMRSYCARSRLDCFVGSDERTQLDVPARRVA